MESTASNRDSGRAGLARESEADQKKEAAEKQAEIEQAELAAADDDSGKETAGENSADQTAEFDDEIENSEKEYTPPIDSFDSEDGEDSEGSEDAEDAENIEDVEDVEDDDGSEDKVDDVEDADAEDAEAEDDDSVEDSEDKVDDAEDGDDAEDKADDETDNDGPETDGKAEFRLEITAPSKKLLAAIPDLCKKFGSKISITVAGLDPADDGEEGGYATAIECQDEETLNAVKEEDAVKEAVGGMDGELNESLQYEPNTVGAVIKLLSKYDPRDFLFIRLAPNMKQCMIYDMDSGREGGEDIVYMEIALGKPE